MSLPFDSTFFEKSKGFTRYYDSKINKSKNVIIQLTHQDPVGLRVSFSDQNIRDQFLEKFFKIASFKEVPKEILSTVFTTSSMDKKGIYIQPNSSKQPLGAFLSKEGEVCIHFGTAYIRDIFLKMSGILLDDSNESRCETEQRPNWKDHESDLDAYAPSKSKTEESIVYFNPYQLPPPATLLNTALFGQVLAKSEQIGGVGNGVFLKFTTGEACRQFMTYIQEQAVLAKIPVDEMNQLLKHDPKNPLICHITPAQNKFLGIKIDDETVSIKLGKENFRKGFFRALSLTDQQAKWEENTIRFLPKVLLPPNIAYDYVLKEQTVNLEAAGLNNLSLNK